MKLATHMLGAFDTVAATHAGQVSKTEFLLELQSRGFSSADCTLVLDKSMLKGRLERLPDGELRKPRNGSDNHTVEGVKLKPM